MKLETLFHIKILDRLFSGTLMGKVLSKPNPLLNRTEHYNRVDKINMNNPKIVSPEKTGKNHFALANEISQPKTRQMDDFHKSQQERHIGT